GRTLPSGARNLTRSGPVPVMRHTIFNSSPTCGGTRPGPSASPHNDASRLVPRISFRSPPTPNRDGMAHGVCPLELPVSPARAATDDPSGGVAIESLTVDSNEDGSVAALTEREVEGAGSSGRQWDGDDLPTFGVDGQSAVAPFEAQRFDVGAGGFRDAQAVQ